MDKLHLVPPIVPPIANPGKPDERTLIKIAELEKKVAEVIRHIIKGKISFRNVGYLYLSPALSKAIARHCIATTELKHEIEKIRDEMLADLRS